MSSPVTLLSTEPPSHQKSGDALTSMISLVSFLKGRLDLLSRGEGSHTEPRPRWSVFPSSHDLFYWRLEAATDG